MTTNALQEASDARRERLIALRQRKLGQEDPEKAYVLLPTPPCPTADARLCHSKEPFRFRQRNFDPETRTLKKHTKATEEDDTVEKAVDGLAEKIIAEDEERRQQELVRTSDSP